MPDETKPDLPVTTEDTSDTALDVVTDLALDSTIPAPIRKNALKAFDRLCSALIDVPVGALERRSAEKRAESEARIKIRDEITTQITQQIKVDPEYALRSGHKYAEKIIREQLNLDKISAIAADELKKTIAAETTNQSTDEPNKEVSAEETNQGTDNIKETTINDDWLNNFENEARQVSTEDMQRRFGRVLAGEIGKPDSYSMKSVKTLGELSENAAILFKRLCSACVVMEFPATKNVPDMRVSSRKDGYGQNIVDIRVLSLGGNPELNELSEYGLGFQVLNILNEYGMIISAYNSSFEYNLFVDNKSWFPILELLHQEQRWILLPSGKQDKNQVFKWIGVELSQVGRELFHIVDQDPMPEYTKDLKKFFLRQKLQMVEVPPPDPMTFRMESNE